MGGGAWSFLVGGVICLLNCDNERDLSLLNSKGSDRIWGEGGVCLFGCGIRKGIISRTQYHRIPASTLLLFFFTS